MTKTLYRQRCLYEEPSVFMVQNRINIARQVIDLVTYIHSRQSLYRHLCPQYVRLSLTENDFWIKLTHVAWDQDLDIKKVESEKERKSSDSALPSAAFDAYQLEHEIYALTRPVLL